MTQTVEIDAASGRELALPRVFACIFFAFAAFIGILTFFAALVYLIAGNWRTSLLMASAAPIVITITWLGRILWSGRAIPMWFIYAFGGLIELVTLGTVFAKGQWVWGLIMLFLLWPLFVHFRACPSGFASKPKKTHEFDDFG